ncbi:MAG TPA: tape measure protein [Firmicutes bacterium]|nr:tape measure protein [Bacillota bacterium]
MELFRLFGVVDLQGNMALMQLREIDQQARKAGSTLGGLVKQAASFAAGIGLWQGFTATARALGNTFIGLNTQFQQAGMALETMLGSSEKARSLLSDLEAFAARTPFEFPELMDATQRMMALGFSAEEVIPTLQAVGDAAAAMHKGKEGIDRIILALGQMRAKGKVTGEEMRQLTEAGIPAWDLLARAIGKSVPEVQKLAEKGLIPADKAVQVLVQGMEDKFAGMMDKFADMFPGVVSTIRDNVKMLFKDLTSGPFADMTEWLKGIRDWTSRIREAYVGATKAASGIAGVEAESRRKAGLAAVYDLLVPKGSKLREELDPVLTALNDFWKSVTSAASKFVPVIRDAWESIRPVALTIARAIAEAGSKAAQLAGVIADNWSKIKPVILGVATSFAVLKTSMALEKAAKGIPELISSIVEKGRYQAKLFDMAIRDSSGVLGKFKAAIQALTGVNPVFLAIGAAVTAVAVLAFELYRNWKDVPPFFRALWETIKATFALGWSGIAVVLREMQLGVAKVLNATLGNVLRFAAKVAEVFGKIPGAREFVGGIQAALEGGAEWFAGFEESSAKALDEAKGDILEASRNLGQRWEELKATGSVLGKAIGSDLAAIFTAAKAKAKEAFGAIIPGLQSVGDKATEAGRKAETGLGDGFGLGAEEARQAVDKAVSAIEKLISEAGNTLGEGTDKAAVRLQNALASAMAAVKALGGAAGQELADDLSGAAALVEAAVKGRSEEAAVALLEKLGRASAKVASLIKDDSGEAAQSLKNALSEAAQEVQDRFKQLTEEAKKQQIESIDRLNDALVSALRKRYEKEKEQRTRAVRDAIDAEKERVDAIIAEIDRERWAREEATNDALRLQIRSIWAEIDAIEELTRKEEEEAKQAEQRARILELQAKIAEETDPVERQKLQMELAKELAEQERQQILAQREERKKQLQKQLEDIRYQQEQSLKAFQATKQKELDYLENEYYPRLLQDAALQAEAEKMILAGKHAEILELLQQYGEGWKDLGKTFGERLIEGIGPYIDELNKMVSSALTAASGARTTPASGSGGGYAEQISRISASDLAKLRENSRQWWEVQNNPNLSPEQKKAIQDALHAENAAIQGKYGIPAEASETEINWSRMHSGGIVKSNPLAEFLRNALLLKPQEVPVILQEGEIVLPRSFRLPNLASLGSVSVAPAFAGAPTINVTISDCTFQDGTDAGRQIGTAIVSELRRRGVMRY